MKGEFSADIRGTHRRVERGGSEPEKRAGNAGRSSTCKNNHGLPS